MLIFVCCQEIDRHQLRVRETFVIEADPFDWIAGKWVAISLAQFVHLENTYILPYSIMSQRKLTEPTNV